MTTTCWSTSRRKKTWGAIPSKNMTERPKNRLFSRTVRGYSNSIQENVANMQFDYLKKMAQEGEILRGGGPLLGNDPEGKRGLCVDLRPGRLEVKRERIMRLYRLSEDEAEHMMSRKDWGAQVYHNYYCKGKWGDSGTMTCPSTAAGWHRPDGGSSGNLHQSPHGGLSRTQRFREKAEPARRGGTGHGSPEKNTYGRKRRRTGGCSENKGTAAVSGCPGLSPAVPGCLQLSRAVPGALPLSPTVPGALPARRAAWLLDGFSGAILSKREYTERKR